MNKKFEFEPWRLTSRALNEPDFFRMSWVETSQKLQLGLASGSIHGYTRERIFLEERGLGFPSPPRVGLRRPDDKFRPRWTFGQTSPTSFQAKFLSSFSLLAPIHLHLHLHLRHSLSSPNFWTCLPNPNSNPKPSPIQIPPLAIAYSLQLRARSPFTRASQPPHHCWRHLRCKFDNFELYSSLFWRVYLFLPSIWCCYWIGPSALVNLIGCQ